MPRASNTGAASSAPGHSDRGHARFSPSASERWLNCPGSVPFIELLVATRTIQDPSLDRSGHAANRGTLAHELGEVRLTRNDALIYPPDTDEGQAWRRAFDAMPAADQELIERHATIYFNYVSGLVASLRDMATVPEGVHTYYETRVDVSAEVWGSIDAAIVLGRELWVIDLKTGHRAVSPIENTQLMTYATGICKRLRWEIDVIHIIIVQPEVEADPLVWDTTPVVLKRHLRRINAAVAKAEAWDARNPSFTAGDHCDYCPAKGECPAQRSLASQVFDGALEVADNRPVLNLRPVGSLTPEQRAFILTHEKAMREWLDAVREDVIRNHRAPPGFKIVAANSRTRWRDEDAALTYFGQHHPGHVRRTPPTITDARRVLSTEAFENLTESPVGAPTVVPESDRRAALPPPGDVFNVQAPSPCA
jgi:hypothetical protein